MRCLCSVQQEGESFRQSQETTYKDCILLRADKKTDKTSLYLDCSIWAQFENELRDRRWLHNRLWKVRTWRLNAGCWPTGAFVSDYQVLSLFQVDAQEVSLNRCRSLELWPSCRNLRWRTNSYVHTLTGRALSYLNQLTQSGEYSQSFPEDLLCSRRRNRTVHWTSTQKKGAVLTFHGASAC